MAKEELLAEIKKAKEITKDYNKFSHLFNDDEAIVTMAELNRTLEQIELHLELSEMKEIVHPENKALEKYGATASLVKIKPCDEKYGGKTYLGFLIGQLAIGSSITITDNKLQCNWSGHNPAVFVPELGEVIMGCESWWGRIKSEEEFKEITEEDIDNVWYVKCFKKMNESKK